MFFNLLIVAGTETTRESIAIGLLALIENPEQLQTLRTDRRLKPTAIEEMLRWTTPDPCNRRTATQDVELADQQIRAGDKVTLGWASANRGEEVFDDPFRFDVTRSANPHLAFGHRAHFCLGANVARLEMSIMFDELLNRLEGFELAGPVQWNRSNTHTGIHHLPIAFRSR